MKVVFKVFILTVIVSTAYFIGGTNCWAQDDAGGGGGKRAQQFGAFVGRVLPHGMDGVDEIFGLWGLRYSMPFGKSNGFLDGGTLLGNSGGVEWKSLFVTMSMQLPVETLIGHAGVGADFTMYKTDSGTDKSVGGVHFVGGVMNRISSNALVRFDMKLSSAPGTSLFFGLGLVIELGAGDAAGGGAE